MPDGTAKCWGESQHGQAGPIPDTPVGGALYPQPTPTTIPGLANVAQLALGQAHTCALLTDGRVACFGQNDYGQCGLAESPIIDAGFPRPVDVRVATIIPGLTGVVEIAAGHLHTCARMSDRTVRCFGSIGVEGTARGVPIPIEGIADVAQLAIGRWHTCLRHVDGTVTCWGSNSNGQLARDLSYRGYAGPEKVAGVANAVEIAAGDYHTCVRHADGKVTCWGANGAGESGGASYWVDSPDGGVDAQIQVTPPEVPPTVLAGVTGAVGLSLGAWRSCALVVGDRVVCWGYVVSATEDWDGALPPGDARPSVLALPFTDVVQIGVGAEHACVRQRNDTVLCFGSNAGGWLGDGTTAIRREPVRPLL